VQSPNATVYTVSRGAVVLLARLDFPPGFQAATW
jgi:hypothetical protein